MLSHSIFFERIPKIHLPQQPDPVHLRVNHNNIYQSLYQSTGYPMEILFSLISFNPINSISNFSSLRFIDDNFAGFPVPYSIFIYSSPCVSLPYIFILFTNTVQLSPRFSSTQSKISPTQLKISSTQSNFSPKQVQLSSKLAQDFCLSDKVHFALCPVPSTHTIPSFFIS